MNGTALHATPRLRDIGIEQVRALGGGLRRQALIAAVLAAVATAGVGTMILRGDAAFDFHPERTLLPALVALLLPIAVWRGQHRGAGIFWTLPVDHCRHMLARTFAGWVWLMAGVALLVLWLLGIAVISGNELLAPETLRFLPASISTDHVDPAAVETVVRAAQPLLWLVPFTAATAVYLFATALALGTAHPVRAIGGTLFALLLLHTVGVATDLQWLEVAPFRLLQSLVGGEYGLDALLSARTESQSVEAALTTGERIVVWRAFPDIRHWATATILWTGAALIAVGAAAWRHREHRH
jgi:hypothetical protein